ncbi:MAG: stage II sporulation protein M [Chloroflexi bacterium]|nr:stage II sporulation protein M [Chloroflexota bacterium]
MAHRRLRWERLSALLDRASSARAPLSVDELDELARLYRQVTGDLAVARRDFPDDQATLFVNQLVTRAHGIVYRDPPAPLSRLRRFFGHELPQEYRSAWPYLLASAGLFFGPLLAAALAILVAPGTAALMLPPGLLAEIKAGQTWFDANPAERSYLASFLMAHNIQVSFLALGGGMLAGVGTAAILVFNGLFIGAVAGALAAYGLGDRLVGFVSPHGFFELSVIVVAGGCGLMLGRAIVWPGLRTRGERLAEAGARSVRLLLGVLPFLAAAGLLEGFVSPSPFAWPFKLALGLATAVVLYGYLLLTGRPRPGRAS